MPHPPDRRSGDDGILLNVISSTSESPRTSSQISEAQNFFANPLASSTEGRMPLAARGATFARHTIGLFLLLMVVFLWTLCNFLGSSIFADNTYAKPFFLTYLNTSCFALGIIPVLIRSGYQKHQEGDLSRTIKQAFSRREFKSLHLEQSDQTESLLKPDEPDTLPSNVAGGAYRLRKRKHLGFRPTASLSLTFCMLWFSANYFAMSCLQFTTVASTTILTSTSSIWTLSIGGITGAEPFTWRKLLGVAASFVGIIIISRVDLSQRDSSKQPASHSVRAIDTFPDKAPRELALGDALALFSAVIYGFYTIKLKHTTIKAAPLELNLALFFGLVGLFNAILLFPLFPILHWTGIERFQLPPTRRIWTILLMNAMSSLLSDFLWAYAMLLTSPLVVTVGLTLTIPLSLVGEMIIQGRTEGIVYWIGAAIVVSSFVFVAREEVKEEEQNSPADAVNENTDEADLFSDESPTPIGLGPRRASDELLG